MNIEITMPQVHNRQLMMEMDSSSFGKTSRYMAVTSFTEDSRKRVEILNFHEKLKQKTTLSRMVNRNNLERIKYNRATGVLKERLKHIQAYKKVTQNNSILRSKDYKQSLNKKYSFQALKPEINSTLIEMQPAVRRELMAKKKIERNRSECLKLIEKNLDAFDTPEQRAREERKRQMLTIKDEDDEDSEILGLSRHPTNLSVRKPYFKRERSKVQTMKRKGSLRPLKPLPGLESKGQHPILPDVRKTHHNLPAKDHPLDTLPQKVTLPPLDLKKTLPNP
ncbi:unnamed protein product [Owenia fusiformis]|uniref:Uncharacterized protein n=1 Tax=Owenia fusiformis TaxID=6347 RepID=A0A8S4NQT4_OWEFU|nr:unnamed protein product [Owenia fusiformis]